MNPLSDIIYMYDTLVITFLYMLTFQSNVSQPLMMIGRWTNVDKDQVTIIKAVKVNGHAVLWTTSSR